jgi:hypothetical protein
VITALPARLHALARDGKTITYGALARDLDVPFAQLTAALEAMMEEDAAADRPFRAALCEGRLNHGLPARGFYDKAAELGADVTDPAALAETHRAALFAAAKAR